jgi:hypothetical protein
MPEVIYANSNVRPIFVADQNDQNQSISMLDGRKVIIVENQNESDSISGLFWTAVGAAWCYYGYNNELPYLFDRRGDINTGVFVALLLTAGAAASCFSRANRAFSEKTKQIFIVQK